jgi:hypothetical protein
MGQSYLIARKRSGARTWETLLGGALGLAAAMFIFPLRPVVRDTRPVNPPAARIARSRVIVDEGKSEAFFFLSAQM